MDREWQHRYCDCSQLRKLWHPMLFLSQACFEETVTFVWRDLFQFNEYGSGHGRPGLDNLTRALNGPRGEIYGSAIRCLNGPGGGDFGPLLANHLIPNLGNLQHFLLQMNIYSQCEP
jgi:hypothetical protein